MTIFFALLIAAIVVYFAFQRRRARRSLQSEPVFATIPGDARYEFNIVGESNYQDVLESICGGRTDDSANKRVQAVLYMENQNPYDNQAVRVDIERRTVGYLSREDARSYRKRAATAGYNNLVITCDAMIVGGWERKNSKGHFGVKLDLPPYSL